MPALRTFILAVWIAFWAYWLLSAATAKQSTPTRRLRLPGILLFGAYIVARVVGVPNLNVHSDVLEVLGTIVFLSGLGLAVWARIHLGRNWGMPMTERADPELITSGPYRFARHPIYTGILLALAGAGLATNLDWLIATPLLGAYFFYSARVEEANLATTFPATYPGYRAKTKMLIPFVL